MPCQAWCFQLPCSWSCWRWFKPWKQVPLFVFPLNLQLYEVIPLQTQPQSQEGTQASSTQVEVLLLATQLGQNFREEPFPNSTQSTDGTVNKSSCWTPALHSDPNSQLSACLGRGHMPVFFLCCSLLELKTFSRRTGFLKRLLTKAPASGSSQLPPASARRRCFLLLKNESLFLPLTLLFVYRRWSVSSPFPSFIPHLQHGAGV